MDLDASIKNTGLSKESIKNIFESIVSIDIDIDIDDDIIMIIKSIDEIREEFDYTCFRIALEAKINNTIIPMKVDISTGDVITPSEIKYEYSLLLEKRKIEIFAYNLETILAEKMETIISRGVLNTRMRDFYDIYILNRIRNQEIDIKTLKKAFERTSNKRKTKIQYEILESDVKKYFQIMI
jgi:predicted nucleotidyltransferase component of viral defense system